MDVNELFMLTLEQEVLNEQAAETIADIYRLIDKSKASNDFERAILLGGQSGACKKP